MLLPFCVCLDTAKINFVVQVQESQESKLVLKEATVEKISSKSATNLREIDQKKGEDEPHDLTSYIKSQLVGEGMKFRGPFGVRSVIYCDHTASGKSLKFIEDFILNEVLPHYGNTHTTSSLTSMQTTMYRNEARLEVRKAVNATEDDAVIFCGQGTTSAIHKLISILGWADQSNLGKRKLVIFVSNQVRQRIDWFQAWLVIVNAIFSISEPSFKLAAMEDVVKCKGCHDW